MTALELISLINQVLFIGLFGVVLWHALRRRSRASWNTALLLGSVAVAVAISRVAGWFGLADEPAVSSLTLILLNAVPFAMLRLVDDFSGSPRWVQAAGASAFVALSALTVVGLGELTTPLVVATIAFFLAVGGYAAIVFALESRRAHGITRRRMTAVALGAALFIAAIVVLFIGVLLEPLSPILSLIGQLLALAAVMSFFLGFAPPAWVRRAWREPDLRRFLESSVHLAGVADEHAALTELERAAAAAFGANGASIGLADEERRVIRYAQPDGSWGEFADDVYIAGRAFSQQRRLVVDDATEADPENAQAYEQAGARTVIAAPITTDDRRIGVLTVYAERAPIFVEDDLWLLELLASQTGLLLEARTLTAHASELRAREDATRLKEEFLSAAAHDLRTPLTVVLGQAELMERRAIRNPGRPVDEAGLARIVREARRLRDLVAELLDAQRLEDGRAVLDRSPADVSQVVETVRERHAGNGVEIEVSRPSEPLVSSIDRPRIDQVLDNLVENALKYGPSGGAPEIEVSRADDYVRISVIDHGVGIPEAERERIFERFYRASNAQDVTDTGLGLGLYICRRIVDEHDGRIRHEETPGGGSTFVIDLPLDPGAATAQNAEPMVEEELPHRIAGQAVADA
ncbi:MAG TPA: ATP-binding protein [Patescibacteria group bacterium]|nr:ATP-binding protein [Patescibacteria group bacterium]